ncbi:hypothetical protein JYU34_000936 [Plutella xylostella]|uniref:C2H2-type domain-containing protein n=1 Tax=Plutella xylostella TaxID=51655 RepID=A0ABQ7R5N9_PLUXY|nr:hypothetical protein JYU34_000936 [Plutella xylostella]
MSHGGSSPSSSEQTLTAELRDGQLQIVEMSPLGNDDDGSEGLQIETEDGAKYVQVLDESGRGLMHLNLLNLTLVRCEDGEDGYRLTTTEDNDQAEYITPDTNTVCVLQSSDGGEDQQDQYVMLEGEDGPVMYLQSDLGQASHTSQTSHTPTTEKEPSTAVELLQRAKALHKAKRLLRESMKPQTGAGRRRRAPLPAAGELLSSPNFKLFLYSCKLCSFKCNAVRELTEHRSTAHNCAKPSLARGTRAPPAQCARCPYKANSHYLVSTFVHKNVKYMKKEKYMQNDQFS